MQQKGYTQTQACTPTLLASRCHVTVWNDAEIGEECLPHDDIYFVDLFQLFAATSPPTNLEFPDVCKTMRDWPSRHSFIMAHFTLHTNTHLEFVDENNRFLTSGKLRDNGSLLQFSARGIRVHTLHSIALSSRHWAVDSLPNIHCNQFETNFDAIYVTSASLFNAPETSTVPHRKQPDRLYCLQFMLNCSYAEQIITWFHSIYLNSIAWIE